MARSTRTRRSWLLALALALAGLGGCGSEQAPAVEQNPCAPSQAGALYQPDGAPVGCTCGDAAQGALTCSKGAAFCFCAQDAG